MGLCLPDGAGAAIECPRHIYQRIKKQPRHPTATATLKSKKRAKGRVVVGWLVY